MAEWTRQVYIIRNWEPGVEEVYDIGAAYAFNAERVEAVRNWRPGIDRVYVHRTYTLRLKKVYFENPRSPMGPVPY